MRNNAIYNASKFIIHIGAVILFSLLVSCSYQQIEPQSLENGYESLRKNLKKQSEKFAEHQQAVQASFQQKNARKPALKPVLPKYNPLDDLNISFTVENASVRHILRALALEISLNLSLHPDVASEDNVISVQFEQVPASIVLKEILRISDLYGEVDGNILRVSPYQEQIFYLNFIESNLKATFDIGGDVLGTGGDGDSRLTGNFKISGTGSTASNPYDVLEKMVQKLVTSKGILSLNRLGGILYVKERPSIVKSIEKLVVRYKDMLSRQILIEARIMEVGLSDGFKYGIDWSLIRNVLNGTDVISQGITQTIDTSGTITRQSTLGPSAPATGIILSRTTSGSSQLFAVSLLENFGNVQVLSNPTIRARHGQPAMISVGRSNTYISEIKTTTNTTTTTGTTSIDIATDTVFDGLLLGVTPFIADDGQISLSINPIKSDVEQTSLEQITVQNASISLPRVNLKEMSTTIQVQDGDTVILGGLMDNVKSENRSGLGGLASIPFIGRLFSNEDMSHEIRELIIVLRVTQL